MTPVQQTSSRMLLAIGFLGLLTQSPSAMCETATSPYQAVWPIGWEIVETAGPRPYSEKDLGGRTIKAFKKENGQPAVCIALMYFPRSDRGQANIKEEFDTYITTVKKEYQAKGYTVVASAPNETSLGAQPAIENELTVNGKNFVLKQTGVMAMSPKYFFQLSFSGLKSNFDKYRGEFDACRKSLKFN